MADIYRAEITRRISWQIFFDTRYACQEFALPRIPATFLTRSGSVETIWKTTEPRINSGYFKVILATCSKLTSKPTSSGIRAGRTVDVDGFVTREFGLWPCELCRNSAGSQTVREVVQTNCNKRTTSVTKSWNRSILGRRYASRENYQRIGFV